MIFYSVNVLFQCLAVTKLRRLHPQLPRPKVIIPAPLLCLPAAVALGVFALAPAAHLFAAATVLGGTAGVYTVCER